MDGSTKSKEFAAYRIRRGAGVDGLTRVTRTRAALGPHDVRVRMRAVALNYRDLMIARGDSGVPDLDVVAASDGAGEVVEIGQDVTRFRVGDRVMGSFFPDWHDGLPDGTVATRALGGTADGVLAAEVVMNEGAWVSIPAHLDFVEAATIPCAAVTAWNALFVAAPLKPGDSVLLLGTGGVSIWALQLAKAAGLRVVITSSDDAKLDRAVALGADATINYRRTPDWENEVLRLTGGRGADRVLDIGGPDTLPRSIAAVRVGGTVAVIGRLTGTGGVKIDPAALFGGSKRLAGVLVGSRAMTDDVSRFVEQTGIRPVIDKLFDFEHVREAYEYLGSSQHFGKVVIRI
ncbi:MAG TPA: NAD(P)-dependent alcohol dehydrogenase [Rhodanobacteraceae bacterium]|nr:NAD(P)-dependent alcohol dehydrogenase [Rhodanobacteraceae bacterium]